MHKKLTFYSVALCLLYSFSVPVLASNFSFLKDSILNRLPETDLQLLKQETAKILETNPDKKITKWEAPTSKIKVKILPKLSYTEDGKSCRRTLFKLTDGSRNPEVYGFVFCKNADGAWKVTQSRLQNLTDDDMSILEKSVMQLFDANKIGVPMTWGNPATKISGTLVLIKSSTRNKQPCKKVSISLLDTTGVSLEGQYLLCKSDKGWERAGQ
jgi:surface antigen